jgi:hypothetical protein
MTDLQPFYLEVALIAIIVILATAVQMLEE